MAHIKTMLSVDDLLEPKFESTRVFAKLKESFRVGNSTLLVVSPVPTNRNFTERELCRIRKWFYNERLVNAELRVSFSPFDARQVQADRRHLFYPELIQINCENPQDKPSSALESIHRTPWDGILIGKKSTDLLMEFTLWDAPAGSAFGTVSPEVMKMMRERFLNQVVALEPGLSYHWVGAGDFQYYMLEGMQKSSVLNGVILLFLCIAFRVLYGTWICGVLYCGVLILGAGILFGAMALCGVPMDVLSSSLFLMLVVASLEDFIFLFNRGLKRREPWRSSFKSLVVPGFLTSFTTILGFGSLYISDLAIIRRFGLWAAIGALLEWVLVFFILPALLKLWKKGQSWANPQKAYFGAWTEKFSKKRMPRFASVLCLVVFLFVPWATHHLDITDAPILLFPKGHPLRLGVDYLHETRGWETAQSLVFEDYEARAHNEAIIAQVERLDDVAGIESPYDLDRFMTDGKTIENKNLIRRELKETAVYQRLVSEDRKTRALIYLKDTDLKKIHTLRDQVQKICAHSGCVITGGTIAYADFADEIPTTLLESLLLSLILVALTITLLAFSVGRGRPKQLPFIIVSSNWGAMVMLLAAALMQIRVNFMTCVFASVLVGLAGDNAIQYLCAARRHPLTQGMVERGGASLQCTLLMSISALTFLGNYFAPARVFGIMLSVGLLLSLAGDLWILRGLISSD